MNYFIRPYHSNDFQDISNWWNSFTSQIPPEGLMSENGSFVLEIDKVPALCLTVLKTQSKEICYLEYYIKNPLFKQSLDEYGKILWNYCYDYAKELGYKRIMCITRIDQLKPKFERFGMSRHLDNVSSFLKEL